MEEFVEVTEIDERAVRRLAASKGITVIKTGDNAWTCCDVAMDSDDVWSCLSNV